MRFALGHVKRLQGFLADHARAVLLVALSCVVAGHMTSLTLSPICWQDEVQIVDFGRTFLDGSSDRWSMNLSASGQPPVRGLIWVGQVIQEGAYRLTGGSMAGPRLASLLALGALVTGIFKWLERKGFSAHVCLVCALLVLVHPLLIQGVRGARVDAWAMAAVVWALYLVNCYTDESSTRVNALWFFLAGGLFALGCFVWITAPILGLLLAVEAWQTGLRHKWPIGTYFLFGAIGMTGFLAMFIILSQPFFPDVLQAVGRTGDGLGAGSGFRRKTLPDLLKGMTAVLKYLRPAPTLFGLAFVGFIGARRQQVLYICAVAVSVLVFSRQMVYDHRVIYLLPYAVYFVAVGLCWAGRQKHAWVRPCVQTAVVLTLLYGFGHTVLARNAGSLLQRSQRSMKPLATQIDRYIAPGPRNVLLFTDQLYYVGRAKGWRLHAAWNRSLWTDPFAHPMIRELLWNMDYVVFEGANLSDPTRARLKGYGWAEELLIVGTATGRPSKYGPFSIWKPSAVINPQVVPVGFHLPPAPACSLVFLQSSRSVELSSL